MNSLKNDGIRQAVRQQYGLVVENGEAGCGL